MRGGVDRQAGLDCLPERCCVQVQMNRGGALLLVLAAATLPPAPRTVAAQAAERH